jgi:hypothetical protein
MSVNIIHQSGIERGLIGPFGGKSNHLCMDPWIKFVPNEIIIRVSHERERERERERDDVLICLLKMRWASPTLMKMLKSIHFLGKRWF